MTLRECKTCGEKKPATSKFFCKHKQCVGGITHRCKTCENSRADRWREENAELIKERWYARYAKSHKKARRLRDRHYRQHQPERVRARSMFKTARERATKAGLPWEEEAIHWKVLLKQMLNSPNCPCCGRPYDFHARGDGVPSFGKRVSRSPSLDRFIPERGYVTGNLTIICWRCNLLKRDATVEELSMLVRWMRKRKKEA